MATKETQKKTNEDKDSKKHAANEGNRGHAHQRDEESGSKETGTNDTKTKDSGKGAGNSHKK